MDIKDFILIGGGLLITAVVAHGFWIAWKARREPLRLDIAADLIPRDADDDFPAELPNGPSRPLRRAGARQGGEPAPQDEFELEPPMMIDPLERSVAPPRRRAGTPRVAEDTGHNPPPERRPALPAEEQPELWDDPAAADRGRTEPSLGTPATAANDPVPDGPEPEPAPASPALRTDADSPRAQVMDVELPADELVPDRRDAFRSRRGPVDADSGRQTGVSTLGGSPQSRPGRQAVDRSDAGRRTLSARPERTEPAPEVQELIVINVLAPRSQPYTGDELMAALRGRGLKFGDMNIFHRVDPLTRAKLYSVANVIEPGTFELADMASVRTPGVCLFMQLPGPEEPRKVLDDMLAVARALAEQLGGDLYDEQRSVMTPQTVAHYGQRIADFSRRLMSKRA